MSTTTLQFYWNLSAPSRKDRIDASAQLISTLEKFQANYPPPSPPSTDEDEDEDKTHIQSIDVYNAPDVAYAVKRLVRGLASPRESSRLGFAVALSELLLRLSTIAVNQIIELVLQSSTINGSMKPQEERDMLFARLFGFTAIIQSKFFLREGVRSTPSSDPCTNYQRLIKELILLGESKSWFRETCWWSILLAFATLVESNSSFKQNAIDWTFDEIFIKNKTWSPEKLALWLKYSYVFGNNAADAFAPSFKHHGHILAKGNLPQLARVLKEVNVEDDEGGTQDLSHGSWKPNPHFVWTIILETYFPIEPRDLPKDISSFQDFVRVAVDDTLFSSSASAERKYTGFQIIETALSKVTPSAVPQLFTKNFMRTWMNHLSKRDRYLHKAALKLAETVNHTIAANSSAGLSLVVQLLGPNGNRNFDRLTKTKTIETILGSMNTQELKKYIKYMLDIFESAGKNGDGNESLGSDRSWVVDQFGALIKNNLVPKDVDWLNVILALFVSNGYFIPNGNSQPQQATFPTIPMELRELCRTQLSSSLASLLSRAPRRQGNVEAISAQILSVQWFDIIMKIFESHEKDTKHFSALYDNNNDVRDSRKSARTIINRLQKNPSENQEPAMGAQLYLQFVVFQSYNVGFEDDQLDPTTMLTDSLNTITTYLQREDLTGDKIIKSTQDPKPIDLLVDDLIGQLEASTSLARIVANQVFAACCSDMQSSTIDLLLTQLKQPDKLAESSDEGEEDEMDVDAKSDSEGSSSDKSQEGTEGEDSNAEVDEDLRQKVADALNIANGGGQPEQDSEDDMDDEQMIQIDEKLADIFRSRAGDKGKTVSETLIGMQREATHFKARILDFIETFIKLRPDSPDVPRMVLPLLRIVISTGSDEQQFVDKTNGILRSRVINLKTLPSSGVDIDAIVQDFGELHHIARKSPQASKHSIACKGCVVYLSKVLLQAGRGDVVKQEFEDTLKDFLERKGSKVHQSFIAEFINRCPNQAWGLRSEIVEGCSTGKAANSYRQMQCFQFLSSILSQANQITVDSFSAEFSKWVRKCRKTLFSVLETSTTKGAGFTSMQIKEILKVTLHAIRVTKRILSNPEDITRVWDSKSLQKLSSNEGLLALCSNNAGVSSLWQQVLGCVSANDMSTDAATMPNGETARKEKKRVAHDQPSEEKAKKRRRKLAKLEEA